MGIIWSGRQRPRTSRHALESRANSYPNKIELNFNIMHIHIERSYLFQFAVSLKLDSKIERPELFNDHFAFDKHLLSWIGENTLVSVLCCAYTYTEFERPAITIRRFLAIIVGWFCEGLISIHRFSLIELARSVPVW